MSEEAAGGGEGRGDDGTDKSLWSFLAPAGGATPFSPTGCLPESLPTHQQIKKGCHLLASRPIWPQGLALFAPGWKVKVWVGWSHQDLFPWAFLLPDSASFSALCSSPPPRIPGWFSPVTRPTPLLQGQRQLQTLRGPHMAPSIWPVSDLGCRGGDPRGAAQLPTTPHRPAQLSTLACRPWPS